MIVRDKPGPWELLFALKGSILPRVARPVLLLGLFAAAIVALDRGWRAVPHLDPAPYAVFGVALSLFLGFRNNAAYDRWWEARRLWGGLLADLRALAREAEVFLPESGRRRLLLLALAFLHLHRTALRGRAPDAAAHRAAEEAGLGAGATPDGALDAMAAGLAEARAGGTLDGFGARALSARLGSLALGQAGAERIALTPLPYVYSLLIFRTSWLYCLLVPFALVERSGWLTPLFVMIVAYVFLGLAEVTEELSHPFGASVNAQPLDAICRAAEIALAPHLGRAAPPPLAPVDFVLT